MAKRPKARRQEPPLSDLELADLVTRVRYIGSPKHKFGKVAWLGAGKPGPNARTVPQERADPPPEPFTMICPEKWNREPTPDRQTALLQDALRRRQFGFLLPVRVPKRVYIRDPDDREIVYEAKLMSETDLTYKAYPLTRSQVAALKVAVA